MSSPSPWRRDLSASARDFLRVVWPAVCRFCGPGTLAAVEGSQDATCRLFDKLAGIDYWQIRRAEGIRGIASRMQWVQGALADTYRTFTIRKSRDSGTVTEFEKLQRALHREGGWMAPHFTVQAYLGEPRGSGRGPLLAAGVARTTSVVQLIESGHCYVKRTTNADFYVVPWTHLGQDVQLWPEDVPDAMRAILDPSGSRPLPWWPSCGSPFEDTWEQEVQDSRNERAKLIKRAALRTRIAQQQAQNGA